jgi:hypothetical protein
VVAVELELMGLASSGSGFGGFAELAESRAASVQHPELLLELPNRRRRLTGRRIASEKRVSL